MLHRVGYLQPEPPGAVLPEQATFADVPAHHLNAPMPGLAHDGALRRARHGRGRRMPSIAPGALRGRYSLNWRSGR
jgi:hypothetical protein